ncbi:MAG: hypothetical protein F6J93_17890 [Oscillatoria sp. SIO1A7]|nr:hypothetical protein [Oscillatoria sp. SIO1A7]
MKCSQSLPSLGSVLTLSYIILGAIATDNLHHQNGFFVKTQNPSPRAVSLYQINIIKDRVGKRRGDSIPSTISGLLTATLILGCFAQTGHIKSEKCYI